MFFISTFQHVWKWQRPFSPRQPFGQHQCIKAADIEAEIRLQKHHINAANEQQKVKRNYFLERRTFL